jgi:hypothetical protein
VDWDERDSASPDHSPVRDPAYGLSTTAINEKERGWQMNEENNELQTKGILLGNSKVRNYNITFHQDDKEIGKLDFNGPEMKFEGDMEESAKVFFDFMAQMWPERVKEGSE